MSSPSRAIAVARAVLATGLALQVIGAAAQAGKPAAVKPAAPATDPTRAAPPSLTGLCASVNIAPLVQIPVGKSTVMRPSSPVTRILLGNPENARAARPAESPDAKKEEGVKAPAMDTRPGVADVDVLLLAPTEVYLLGKTIGSTNVVMLDRSGACTAFDVVVGMDTTALQAVITLLLPTEKEIRITPAFDSIVLSGMVSDSEAMSRVIDLANAYVRGQDGGGSRNQRVVNMLEVAAPQQVMLEVKVAEISKALLDQFGIDFSRAYVPGDGSMLRFLSGIFGGATGALGQISGTGANGVPFSSVDAVVGGTVPIPGINGGNVTVTYDTSGRPTYTTTYGTVPGRGVTNGALNMQKTDGLVKVLAEPTVMAISGQTGSFLAGGKIFIPVSQDNGVGGGRTITLEEKEFGVSVKFTPTVLGNGLINLRVRPEVSELNATGITISGGGLSAVLPSFTSRKAETTVQLMDGQSFAIGGLIKNNTTTNIKAFPLLGELPVVGALFRSTQFQTDRSELVFVITPRLVKPLPPGYKLPTDGYVPPTRSELILGGKLEGQRSGGEAASAEAPSQGGFDKEIK
ncbi:MAG TPA: type II and III secretion system protein family protein [Ideonella sp.]|nr:type II and III secretion system protein family protein [Ideonella sp.]